MDLQHLGEILNSVWSVLALVVFVGIVIWAFQAKNRRRFEKDAEIPFKDRD